MSLRIKTAVPVLAMMFLFLVSCGNRGGSGEDLYKADQPVKPLAEYTQDNPREWEDFADTHVPVITRARHEGKDALLVTIPFGTATVQHYIEKIGILDKDGNEVLSQKIEPAPNAKTYAYFLLDELPDDEKLKAFARCNLHDLWTARIAKKLLTP